MARISSILAVLLALSVLGPACGDDVTDPTSAPATDPIELHAWLTDDGHRTWASDPAPLPGLNDTGRRVFLNDLADRQGSTVGAAAVRELYDGTSDDAELIGWSVLIKTDDGPEPAENWFFYETFDLVQPRRHAVARHAAPGCVSCHSGAPDVIQTSRADLVE